MSMNSVFCLSLSFRNVFALFSLSHKLEAEPEGAIRLRLRALERPPKHIICVPQIVEKHKVRPG